MELWYVNCQIYGKAILAEQASPSPAVSFKEQRLFVKNIFKSIVPLKCGDVWVKTSASWWRKWKEYVHYSIKEDHQSDEKDVSIAEHPGPIPLLSSSSHEAPKLLPESLWHYLHTIYSSHQVLTDDMKLIAVLSPSGQCRLEEPPLHLRITVNSTLSSAERSRKLVLCRSSTMGHLHDVIRKAFDVPASKRIRVSKKRLKETSSISCLSDVPADTEVENLLQDEDELVVESDVESTASSSSSSASTVNWLRSAVRHLPGTCGLVNVGNTCYMNSVLQCLAHIQPLTTYFMKPAMWKSHLNFRNPLGTGGVMASHYADLVKLLWATQTSAYAPVDFKAALDRCAPQFAGHNQHDSQEFLMFLLDSLHEDLNRSAVKMMATGTTTKDCVEGETNQKPDEELANEAWSQHKRGNDSVMVDLFHGLLRSSIACPDCGYVSVRFDPFSCLSLPLPAPKLFTQKVLFIPHHTTGSGGGEWRALSFTLSRTDTIASLLQAVDSFLAVPPDECKVVNIVDSEISKFYQPDEPLSSLLSHDLICVYHLPPPMDEDSGGDAVRTRFQIPVEVVHVFDNRPVHIPLLVSIATPYVSYRTLMEQLWPQLSRILRIDGTSAASSSSLGHNSTNSGDEEDEDDIESLFPAHLDFSNDFDVELRTRFSSDSAAVPFPLSCGSSSSASSCLSQRIIPNDEEFFVGNAKVYLRWKSSAIVAHSQIERDLLMNTMVKVEAAPIGGPSLSRCSSSTSMSSPARQSATISLGDCLHLFTRPETLCESDLWLCPTCKTQKAATKKFDLWSLPEVLIIHLKRFHNQMHCRNKVHSLVDFPVKQLDLSEWVVGAVPRQQCCVYDLVALSNHSGSLASGHYTTAALNFIDLQWYLFNDDNVSRINDVDDVVSKQAYVLVYRRQNHAKVAPSTSSSSSSSAPSVGIVEKDTEDIRDVGDTRN